MERMTVQIIQKELGELNELFLALVEQGLTRETLEANIERRPALWGRWSHYLTTLPSKVE